MPETISIKERMERQLVATFAAVAGIGSVYRWDGRGLRDPTTGLGVNASNQRLSLQDLDAILVADTETAAEGASGNDSDGTTVKTLTLQVHLKLLQDEQDAEVTSGVINRWLLALEKALMADPQITEVTAGPGGGTTVRLAIDSRVTATGTVPKDVGQRETIVVIEFEVTYEHYRDDPAAGPGISALTE